MSFIEKLRAGDPELWEQAFACLYPVAHEAARSRLGNTHISECSDVAIESLTDLIRAEVTASSEQELRSHVAAIARNKATDRLRKFLAAKRGGNSVESFEALQESGGSEPVGVTHDHFIDQLTINELSDLLAGLTSLLKKEHRVVLQDRFFNQLTYEEIATKHQISVNSVGVYLQRSLAAMKSVIARKPKLMNELAQLIGEGGMVRSLLPLLSAVELGRWFIDIGARYSEESQISRPRTLSDEDRLRMSSEILLEGAVLHEGKRRHLMELAAQKYPVQFEAQRLRQEAELRMSNSRNNKAGCATLFCLALLVLVITVFVHHAIQ